MSSLPRARERKVFPKRKALYALAVIAVFGGYYVVQPETVITGATLPAVAVVSNRLQPGQNVAREAASLLPAAISDAQAAPTLTLADKSSGTILLKDHSGSIIGQLARIPLENEHITEIKPINDIDNGAGRELLSIISKY